VTVTNLGSQSGSLTNGFTYVVVPTVKSVSPNNGPPAGGTAVTITGTNFAAGATVTFGGTAAINVVVVNGTTITATTPAHASGAVTVTVTVNGQSGNLANGFTYNGGVTISFVQVAAATPQSPTGTVSVSYPGAQTAGDLNVAGGETTHGDDAVGEGQRGKQLCPGDRSDEWDGSAAINLLFKQHRGREQHGDGDGDVQPVGRRP
jgi:hypothetical protein